MHHVIHHHAIVGLMMMLLVLLVVHVPVGKAGRHFHLVVDSHDRFVRPLSPGGAEEESEFGQVGLTEWVGGVAVVGVGVGRRVDHARIEVIDEVVWW